MNYFILSQDERIANAIEPIGVTQMITKERWSKGETAGLDELNLQFQIKKKEKSQYVDFIQKPIPLFSDQLKQIIEKYAPRIGTQSVVLIDLNQMRQEVYWLIFPPHIACLADKSEFHRDGTLKRLVVDPQKVAPYPLFTIEGIREEYLLINLAFAESILRRDFTGIRLKKVEKDQRERGESDGCQRVG